MTRSQWKIKCAIPYAGYSLGNDNFSWKYVERIGEIRINPQTLQTEFTVYFTSGNNYVYSYKKYTLEPDYEISTNVFGFKKKTQITDVQYYFKRDCKILQDIYKRRKEVVNAFYEYQRSQKYQYLS